MSGVASPDGCTRARRRGLGIAIGLALTAQLVVSCGETTVASSTVGTRPNNSALTAGSVPPQPNPSMANAEPADAPTAWTTSTGSDGRSFIADTEGRARQFHGFTITTLDPANDASDALLEIGRQRGFNLMRLSIYWDHLEPGQGTYDDHYLNDIDTVMDRAATHGIYVVLDFHQDVFGETFGGQGVPRWATRDDGLPFVKQSDALLNDLQPAVQAAWDHLYEDHDLRQAQSDAWAMVARRFDAKPALFGYDLMTEPFGKVRSGETVAQAATRIQETQLTAMYQRLTDAIRAVDPDHWVFFEPPNVATLDAPVALGRINGDKLIFYPSYYDPAAEPATATSDQKVTAPESDPASVTRYANTIKAYPVANGYPLLIDGWTISNLEQPNMNQLVAQSLALLDELTSGWTLFRWCEGDRNCALDGNGNDRAALAQTVQPYARAIPGSPVSSTFDRATRTLKVVFMGNSIGGTTDIVVPTSLYPEGWSYDGTDQPISGYTYYAKDRQRVSPDLLHVNGFVKGPRSIHVVCVKPKGAPSGCAA